MATNDAGPGDARSLGQLVSDLSEQAARLVRAEIDLAKEELTAKAKQAGIGGGLLAAAAVLACYTIGVGIATVILALSVPFEPWLAALIVFVAMVLLIALLGWLGVRRLKRGVPPTPSRAIESVQDDVAAIKEGLHR
jgi:hypothetical protein